MLKLLRAGLFGLLFTTLASAGVGIGSPGARLYVDPASFEQPEPTGDVFSDTFDYVVARNASEATKLSAFQAAGWDSGNFEVPTGTPGSGDPNSAGWVYTATPASLGISANPSGSSRVLVQEFYPHSWKPAATAYDDFQPDPFLQWGDPDVVGTLPADVWFQHWVMLVETFTVDIGAGSDTFTSTVDTRDKSVYPSREDAGTLYNATFMDGLNWDWLIGSCGYEGINEHLGIPSCPTDEMFLCWDTGGAAFGGGADNQLVSEGDQHKLYQNVNNTTGKIVKGVWTEVTVHLNTSAAGGTLEAWIKPQGQARIKVAEWIHGTTANFTWSIPVDERVGHKVFRLNAVVNGSATAGGTGDHMLVYGSVDIATSADDLPDYDNGGPIAGIDLEAANDDVFLVRASR